MTSAAIASATFLSYIDLASELRASAKSFSPGSPVASAMVISVLASARSCSSCQRASKARSRKLSEPCRAAIAMTNRSATPRRRERTLGAILNSTAASRASAAVQPCDLCHWDPTRLRKNFRKRNRLIGDVQTEAAHEFAKRNMADIGPWRMHRKVVLNGSPHATLLTKALIKQATFTTLRLRHR